MAVQAILLATLLPVAGAQTGTDGPSPQTDFAPLTNAPVGTPAILVTATRTEEESFALPYSVDVVSPADFARKLPRTTPEALRELPSIMLQKTSHGQGSPYLRGFTGFRTLMLVDGIRLNNSTFRDGPNQYWSTIDALSLDRMEVVRGPSSVLYGSDAIGGTVNAISTGRTSYGEGFDWDARTFYRYSSAEQSHVGRVEASGQYDNEFGFHIGVSPKNFGDLRGGEDVGAQRKTGYDELDWDTKLEYRITPSSRFVYGHQTVNMDDAWRAHSTIYGRPWEGTTVGSDLRRLFDQGRDLDYLQYHTEALPGFVEEMHFSVSYHRQDETEDRVRSTGIQELQSVDVQTLGLSAQFQSPSPVGRWVYGAEYYHDWVDSSFRRYNAAGDLTQVRVQGPVADDATYDLVGAYVEDHIPLANDRLQLILGGRYTYAQVDANKIRDPSTGGTFSLNDSWDNVVGNARLLYKLDSEEHFALFVGASQGFRAPNLSDLTRWDADWGLEVPSPGVNPEQFLSLEGGARVRYERFTAEASYFHTLIDDMIMRVPTGETNSGVPVVTKQNSGQGYIHGVELSGSLALHRDWTLWANFTWMEGEVESPLVVGGPVQSSYLSRLMPVTVNSGLRWQYAKWHVWAEFAATFATDADKLAPNDRLDTQRIPPGGTPGYAVYHLRAGWNPCRYATISAALENLLDKDYRIHGSGVNEPGRNLILAADFRF
jgi:hemoglobin/transferrin/lactoferrin receptor protein